MGRKVLYLVRWAPPYDDPSHDCEINDRAFDRQPGVKLPPALCDYWKQFTAPERPVAYRKLDHVPKEARESTASMESPKESVNPDMAAVGETVEVVAPPGGRKRTRQRQRNVKDGQPKQPAKKVKK